MKHFTLFVPVNVCKASQTLTSLKEVVVYSWFMIRFSKVFFAHLTPQWPQSVCTWAHWYDADKQLLFSIWPHWRGICVKNLWMKPNSASLRKQSALNRVVNGLNLRNAFLDCSKRFTLHVTFRQISHIHALVAEATNSS